MGGVYRCQGWWIRGHGDRPGSGVKDQVAGSSAIAGAILATRAPTGLPPPGLDAGNLRQRLATRIAHHTLPQPIYHRFQREP